jgi:outer membrane lipoprotein-sorting protein
VLLLVPMSGIFAQAASAVPDFKAMLKTIDERSNFTGRDFSAKIKMVSEDPEKGTTTRVAKTFRRDRDDSFLILFMEPADQLGQGYLKLGDNMWFYEPQSRKFTHSSLKENVQGTDAKNSDFRQSTYSVDYTVTSWTEGKLGAYDVWILELQGATNEVTYPYKKIYVTKKDQLLLKSEDYSLSKRLLRTSYFTSYAKIGTSYIANSVMYVDALVQGKRTSITFTDISLDNLPDSVFTKAYLERVNR